MKKKLIINWRKVDDNPGTLGLMVAHSLALIDDGQRELERRSHRLAQEAICRVFKNSEEPSSRSLGLLLGNLRAFLVCSRDVGSGNTRSTVICRWYVEYDMVYEKLIFESEKKT